MSKHAASEVVPAAWRRIVYVAAVVVNVAAVVARGLGYLDESQLSAVVAGLSILSGGLALGYVPRRTAVDIAADQLT